MKKWEQPKTPTVRESINADVPWFEECRIGNLDRLHVWVSEMDDDHKQILFDEATKLGKLELAAAVQLHLTFVV